MSLAKLNGKNTVRAHVWIPKRGAWDAEVRLDAEATLSGRVSLVVADVTFSGTIVSGGPSQGSSYYRIVGGGGGWGQTIKAQSYANDALVKASTVLGDAAGQLGETLDASTVPSSMRVGAIWVRANEPASALLDQISTSGWYIAADGVTRLGARPASTLTGNVPRTSHVDRARKVVTLAPTNIAQLVPGVSVDGLSAADVEIVVDDKGLRATVYGERTNSDLPRHLAAFAEILDQIDPLRRFRASWEYRVTGREGKRLNLKPAFVSTGMPELRRVRMRPGVPGAYGEVPIGARVVVSFLDSDPGRPCVVSFADADGDGFAPAVLELGGGTQGFVAIASKVLTELTAIQGALTSHVHAGVTAGAGTSGVAAPIYTPASVASSKVKATT